MRQNAGSWEMVGMFDRQLMVERRSLLAAGMGIGISAAMPAWAGTNDECYAEVETGRLRGIRKQGCDTYFGIPYAGRVSGPARFGKAPPAQRWSGVRDARYPGAPSIQPSAPIVGFSEPDQSENCLFLNIWTPSSDGAKRPVMVYNHGGGFVSGSAAAALQDGTNLARENDVVVVATNHRLGLLGFLYLDEIAGSDYAGSGNRGIEDISAALAWIFRNINRFGGDAANVMIFGESGGGAKTSALYAMPGAAPYFNKASIESGPATRIFEREQAAQTTHKIMQLLAIAPSDWRRLLEVPAATLLKAQVTAAPAMALPGGLLGSGYGGPLTPAPGAFGPVRDGHVLPNHPFEPTAPDLSRDKPLMVGGNADEAMFFSYMSQDFKAWTLDEGELRRRLEARFGARAEAVKTTYRASRPQATASDLYFAVGTALFSEMGSNQIAERKAAQGGAPVFRYEFAFDQGEELPGTSDRMGALHALDIPFKFDNMETKSALPLPGDPPFAGRRPERHGVGKSMSSLWAGFARTGRPQAAGLPEWPAYTIDARACFVIDAPCRVVNDLHRDERLFWEQEDKSPR
jgi:para-nitrobenzyl esterase